jgi:hypothetical protein
MCGMEIPAACACDPVAVEQESWNSQKSLYW